MKIGFIGAGEVAFAIARYALAVGHTVLLSNSGRPETRDKLNAAVAELGNGAAAASIQEAADSDLVVLAVPWLQVQSVLAGLPLRKGRILVDATNPFLQITPSWIFDDLGDDTASEIVASQAPGARVVKAFNSLLMSNFVKSPSAGDSQRLLLVSGDDNDANTLVADLIRSFGFAVIILGDLRAGGAMQQAGGSLAGPDLWLRNQSSEA